MSEPNNTLGVGQDKTPPPAWDPEALQTWPAIVGAVDDMVHNQGDANSHTDLTNNLMSHMWYQLQDDFAEATRTLGRVLEDFQREYTGLKDFAGEAADSFREFAKSIYQGGEDVYNTLTTRDFATTFGNIGHDIQSFSNTFWDFVQQAHDYEKQLAEHYANAINMAEYGEEVDALTVQAQDAYNRQEIELYKSLRNLLADWRDRFADRGNELDTLNVALPPGATDSGGRTGKSGLRDAGGENQEWRKENAEDGRTGKNGLRDASGENQEWRKENAEDGRTGKNGLRDAGGENQEWRKENAAADANSGLQQQMAAGVGDLTKEPVQTASQPGDEQGLDATEGLGVPDTSGAVAPGGGSEPTRPAEPRQLRKLAQMTPAQRAAGEAGSGGGSGAGDEGASAADAAEQERQQGLADAKDAANGALAPLSGSGSGAPGSGTGGGGLPSGSGDKVKIPASLSSAPADDAGGSAGSDSGSAAADEAERQRQADEAERQKGLADAKDAANG
ncbi:hypothetical protein, partial [Amycolatopsis sp. NPDC049868]|uniref:hypothetical protein n=1 Tax=Amycolatopsis sp. NPDC049868 TaxID=3363934 RepID=UPI0037B65CAD